MAQAFTQPERMLDGDPSRARNLWGVALKLIPGGAGLRVEIQRAPDSAGSPDVGAAETIDTVGPFAEGGGVYADPRPKAAAVTWWYRSRHVGQTVDPGAYTDWVGSVAYSIRQEILTGFDGGETYPLPRTTSFSGQKRTLIQAFDQLVPNSQFDVFVKEDSPFAWTVDAGDSSSALRDASIRFSGDASLKYAFGAGGSAGTYRGVTTNDPTVGSFCVPLRPGVAYRFKVASRVSSIANAPQYKLKLTFNVAGSLTAEKIFTYAAATTWQADEWFVVAPGGAEANSKLEMLFTRGATTALDFWVDAIRSQEEAPETVAGRLRRDSPFDDGKRALKAADAAGKETDDDLFISATKTIKVGTVATPGTITKTIRVPHTELLPESSAQSWFVTNGFTRPNTANTVVILRGALVLPKGVTITVARARMFRTSSTSDSAACAVVRILDDGTVASLATINHSGTGWNTNSQTLGTPQLVGDQAYSIEVQLLGNAAVTDARFMWVEVEYTMPSYDAAY